MAGFDRDSTNEWVVYDGSLAESPGSGENATVPESPEPDPLLAAQHAASEAAACASRAAASSSAAAAAVERMERALAIGEGANEALQRIEMQIDAVAASVDASADYTAKVERSVGRVQEASAEAGARAEAAADVVTELSGRVEAALVKLEARERASVRRSEEAGREEVTLRSFTERADRIVDRLRELEARASPARVWRAPGEPEE